MLPPSTRRQARRWVSARPTPLASPLADAAATFALASTGLNVNTAGDLTGVDSINTIGITATALTFAGAGNINTTGALNLGTSGTATTVTIGRVGQTQALAGNATIGGTLNVTGTTTLGNGTLRLTGASTIDTTAGTTLGIGTANTTGITLGRTAATFALASTGLNVNTAGDLTGVDSIDTIGVTATALTFAGAGNC